MTAFDNIKTNNWPATSNNSEDFLVLKLPLNDAASLTESRDIVAGGTVLYPKRTLTNSGVAAQAVTPSAAPYAVNVKLHTYIYNTPNTLTVNGITVPRGSAANGNVTFTVAVNGNLNSVAWSYDSTSGPYCYMRGIEVDSGDGNGYQLLTDGATNYSNLILGSVESAYPLSNLFSGTIGSGYSNGTRSTSPGTLTLDLAGNKKHYDNNAQFAKGNRISLPSQEDLIWGTRDLTFEVWVYPETDTHGTLYDTGSVNTNGHHALFIDGSYMYWRVPPGTDCLVAHSTSGYTTGEWQHIACVRHNGTLKIYRNGQEVASQANNSDITQGTWGIGDLNGHAPSYRFSGKMQDYRIYNIAKYTANFTPPGAILG